MKKMGRNKKDMSAVSSSKIRKYKSLLKSMTPGELLRLRDDVHRYVQTREWILGRVEKDNTILLAHESGGFRWSIKMDDVDWEAYRKSREKS